jgi:hypothetical protein
VPATIRSRPRGLGTAVLCLVVAAALSGCGNGSDGGAQAPAPATTAPVTPPPSAGPATSAPPPDPARCFLGSFDVVSITAKDGIATPAGTARPAGAGGSLVFDLRPDETWQLRSDGTRPVAFQVGPYTVDARIAGTLRGTYQRAGTAFAFEQDGADGTVTLSSPAGEREYDMDVVGPALAPSGTASITCQTDTVEFVSASVTMTLRRRAAS